MGPRSRSEQAGARAQVSGCGGHECVLQGDGGLGLNPAKAQTMALAPRALPLRTRPSTAHAGSLSWLCILGKLCSRVMGTGATVLLRPVCKTQIIAMLGD